MAHFGHLLLTRGYFLIFYIGIPTYAVAAVLDMQGQLAPEIVLALALVPAPTALTASYLFLRAWREAIAKGAST
jgi:hypothetical protein